MPAQNRFRHQSYEPLAPDAPYCLVRPGEPIPIEGDTFRRRMQSVGIRMVEAGISTLVLVHGTFAGTDALGLIRAAERLLPSLGRHLRDQQKRIVDALARDIGNYTAAYADRLQSSLNCQNRTDIHVELFHWSSENLHSGRAEAAVRLIELLEQRLTIRGGRVLLWGHSHAGNVFALITNLLAADRHGQHQFFRAAAPLYRWPLIRRVDNPLWPRVEAALASGQRHLHGQRLDIVTFGTPIRYGWDAAGYRRLMHFVHHRPVPSLPDYQAPFPPRVDDVLTARYGDYIQQLGVAGTNLTPYLFSCRGWLAERSLSRLLQPGEPARRLIQRLKVGKRVADEGRTLLVDYPVEGQPFWRHLAGHATYTQPEWLLFHAEQVASCFYTDS